MRIGSDLEELLQDLEDFMIANLNTEITAFNAAKAAKGETDPVLATVDDSAYFFQSLNNKVANFNPFVFYGVETLGEGPIAGATSMAPVVDVIVVVSDDGNDDKIHRRMLRYHQVLKKLFEEKFKQVNTRIKLEVGNLDPVSFTIQNSSEDYRAIGVSLGFDFT